MGFVINHRATKAQWIAVLSLCLCVSVVTGAQKDSPPLSIAKQGYLFAGAKYSTINGQQMMSGQNRLGPLEMSVSWNWKIGCDSLARA